MVDLRAGWQSHLKNEFSKPYMENLRNLLRKEKQSGQSVFPPRERIFRALELVDFDDVRIVILGQDPYHGEGQANGLAFAVSQGVRPPPSLVNIFKEISSSIKQGMPRQTTLENWARQGVLLLNTVLTVRANTPLSHRGQGWETFTDKVISSLNEKTTPVIFLLWGSPAAQKAQLITNPHHLILKAPHPSPLSAHRGFLGCDHFAKANAFLKKQGLAEIDWVGGETPIQPTAAFNAIHADPNIKL